jgi:hypothetical protein
MKIIDFIPNGCPRAGFYADLGHLLFTQLCRLTNKTYNELQTNNFSLKINSEKMWVNYQTPNQPPIDYYNMLFQRDDSVLLDLPLNWFDEDQWSVMVTWNYSELNKIAKKYLRPSDNQQNKLDNFIKKNNIDFNKTIGVLYRGTDKYTETDIPDPMLFVSKVESILNEHPDYKIFLQTDQQQVKDLFLQKFNEKCFFNEEIPTTTTLTAIHSLPNINKVSLVENIEISVRLLAMCEYLVMTYGTGSNVSLFASIYRNNPDNVFEF